MEIRGIDLQFRKDKGRYHRAGKLSTYGPCAARRCEQRRSLRGLQSCLSFDTWQPFNPLTPSG